MVGTLLGSAFFWGQAMKCPFCESEMLSGKVSVANSAVGKVMEVMGVFMGGLPSQPHYIYFCQTGGGATTEVDHSQEAFRCSNCEALVIAGTKSKLKGWEQCEPEAPKKLKEERSSEGSPSNCPACGAAINEQHFRCPDCDIALR